MKDTINTKVALELANLSTESLEQLIPFFREFETFSGFSNLRADVFKGDYFNRADLNEFTSYSKEKLGMSKEKGRVKNYRGVSYRSLTKNYGSLLKELLEKDSLIEELYLEVVKNKIEKYTYFIDYLKTGNKDVVITNLKKIYELGIMEFSFDEWAKLDGEYVVGILENKNSSTKDKKYYGIIDMIASDGKKVWLPRIDDTGYPFVLKNASYKITYTKGTRHDGIEMIANHLEFDPNSLPSIEELKDFRVLPDIDFGVIKNKTSAVDINFSYEMLIEKIKELQYYRDYLLFILKENEYSKTEEYKNIIEKLSFLEEFIRELEETRKNIIDNYISLGCVTGYELLKLTNDQKEKKKIIKKKVYIDI